MVPNIVIGVHAAQSAGRAGAAGKQQQPAQPTQAGMFGRARLHAWEATQHQALGGHATPSGWGVLHGPACGGRGARRAHRQQVPEQLLLHVRLAQEGDHEHLLLPHAQARAAVHVAVQVPPGARGGHATPGPAPLPARLFLMNASGSWAAAAGFTHSMRERAEPHACATASRQPGRAGGRTRCTRRARGRPRGPWRARRPPRPRTPARMRRRARRRPCPACPLAAAAPGRARLWGVQWDPLAGRADVSSICRALGGAELARSGRLPNTAQLACTH